MQGHNGQQSRTQRFQNLTRVASQDDDDDSEPTFAPSQQCRAPQLCQDPQAEFALLRESLGVSRIKITSSEYMETQFLKKKRPPKSLKLGEGHSQDSSQGSPRTVWNKPCSAPGSQELLTEGPLMLPVQHTSEFSLQANHGFSTLKEALPE